jgi:hypothetical protein
METEGTLITLVFGGLAILIGLTLLLNRRLFSDNFRDAAPKGMGDMVSDEQARLTPLFGGVAFIVFGVILGVLGFFLKP